MSNHSLSQTALYGVLGSPISHTLSPPMHNLAFRACGINATYCAFEVTPERLEDALRGMRALGIRGLNCTIPLKEAAPRYVDEVDEDVSAIGACNTLENRDGRLIAHNTDILGFIHTLEGKERGWSGASAVVFGAGGSTRAVVYALQRHTGLARITVVNRTVTRAEALAEAAGQWGDARIDVLSPDAAAVSDRLRHAVLAVNTTSLGMGDQRGASPVPDPAALHDDLTAVDLVYRPADTLFLQQARERHAFTVGGLEMLIRQGAESFRIWTGREMPINAVRQHLRTFI